MISHNDLIEISKDMGMFLNEYGDGMISASHKLLHERIVNPQSFVTLVGETSSGKSTIINGLLEKNLLATKASPTTGTVTQVSIDKENYKEEFIAINRDSTYEVLDKQMFEHLVLNPDDNLLRLRVNVAHPQQMYSGLNLFDTPGYNSLIVNHEEVLRTFIPESDIIIHVVNYRVGFGQEDQALLSSIYDEIETKNIPVYLVVNRCPLDTVNTSKRIKEIRLHASDTIHRELDPILIPSIIHEDPDNPKDIFPTSPKLWDYVFQEITGQERQRELLNNSNKLLLNLLKEQRLIFEGKMHMHELNDQEIGTLRNEMEEFSSTRKKLLSILDKYSNRWNRTVPRMLEQQIGVLITSTEEEILNNDKWLDINACSSYINGHFIPFGIKLINKEVVDYFKIELKQMNEEMEEVSNQAIKKLASSVNYGNSKSYNDIINTLVQKIGMKLLGEGAKNLLFQLGGRGGVAAGLGNLAKMGLKNFGLLFGKKFGREIYNAIGRTFNKEMAKRLNVALAVVVEAVVYIHESKTWQKNLLKDVKKSLEEFKKDASSEVVSKTISSIQAVNIDTINSVFDELNKDIETDINSINNAEKEQEKENLYNNIEYIKELETKLGENHE
jgi:GTPase SAR1 family protein